mgnify:CR=1 FL=1
MQLQPSLFLQQWLSLLPDTQSPPGFFALVWPGLQFQRLTTREPDLTMCAVAIAALERVRGDEAVVALEARGDDARAEVAFVQ